MALQAGKQSCLPSEYYSHLLFFSYILALLYMSQEEKRLFFGSKSFVSSVELYLIFTKAKKKQAILVDAYASLLEVF